MSQVEQNKKQSTYPYVGNESDKYRWELVDVMEELSKPTPQKYIKKLPKGGLSYVSGDYVIQQLNRIFLMQWSFSVINQIYQSSANDRHGNSQNPTVQVLGRLEIPGLGFREQWGSSVVKGGADVQESDYKSATTDSLKKCASMFGIAMDLYSGTDGFLPLSPDRLLTEKEKEIKYFRSKASFYSIEEQANYLEDRKKRKKLNSQKEVKKEQDKEITNENSGEIESKIESDISTVIETDTNLSESFIPEGISEIEKSSIEEIDERKKEDVKELEKTPDYIDPNKMMSSDSIEELKQLKNDLNISSNDELSNYLKEFFENDEATAHWINPKNIADVNVFLRRKLNN